MSPRVHSQMPVQCFHTRQASFHIQALKKASDPGCDTLSASLPVSLPWIRNLTIVSSDGRIKCATLDTLIGLDLSDRDYFQRTRQAHDLIFSDFLLSKYDNEPVVVAAYPVSAINPESDLFIVASINLDWMSKVINDLSDRRGIMAFLLDSAGTVMAAPADLTRLVGRPLNSVPALATAAARAINPEQRSGTFSFPAPDGAKLTLSFSSIPGTASRLILIVDEARVAAGINQEIRNAYIQLGLVCLIVLLGALIAAETLIIKPIHKLVAVARRVGDGEWSVRASDSRLPAEFAPLARAFDRMASQLSERERELIASNDHLAVMASIDMLSGLANRRGFQSRLEFEWAKAQQCHCELSLLMIDVDHFKLFNDTYGHPEGDACLSKIGETLSQVALEAGGFAARYGGEEFCLLLPDTDSSRAIEIGEMVRATVQDLAILHATSAYQAVTVSVGVASLRPNPALNPNDLLEAADASLYVAKRQGRNRVAEHGLARAGENGGAVALAG